MNEVIPGSSRWQRWAHEYAFSLNLAWIIVWVERVRSKTLGGPVLAHFVSKLVGGAYQLVSPIGGFTILEQLVWSFGVALILFALLRSLSSFNVANVLRPIAGAVSIAALPIATLFLGLSYPDCCSWVAKVMLTLEVAFALICATVFYLRKPWIRSPLMTVVIALHFTLWAWATSSYFNFLDFSALSTSEYYHSWGRTVSVLGIGTIFHFGLPAFGLLASLSWVRYARHASESQLQVAQP